jgi:hypothetical protein
MTNTEADIARPWWRDPKSVAVLTAILAAIAPLTTCVQNRIQSEKELALERAKQTHEIRQTYLKHVLENDRQTERVLKFLVKVEEDPHLRAWAEDELKHFQKRIKTKNELYNEAVQTVSELVNSDTPGDENSENYRHFWRLYKGDLIPVESKEVAGLMVAIGKILQQCKPDASCDKEKLQQLSFELALAVKRELGES